MEYGPPNTSQTYKQFHRFTLNFIPTSKLLLRFENFGLLRMLFFSKFLNFDLIIIIIFIIIIYGYSRFLLILFCYLFNFFLFIMQVRAVQKSKKSEKVPAAPFKLQVICCQIQLNVRLN